MRMVEPEDIVMTDAEIAELPESKVVEYNGRNYTIYPQKVARLFCECEDDDLLKVMSQRTPGKWYRVIHDGKKALYCECEFALHHNNWCPNHLERAQMVIDRYRKRLSLDKEKKANPVKVQRTELEYPVTPEAPQDPPKEDTHRTDAPLARQQGFNLLR